MGILALPVEQKQKAAALEGKIAKEFPLSLRVPATLLG
jgi:hypothetical protein